MHMMVVVDDTYALHVTCTCSGCFNSSSELSLGTTVLGSTLGYWWKMNHLLCYMTERCSSQQLLYSKQVGSKRGNNHYLDPFTVHSCWSIMVYLVCEGVFACVGCCKGSFWVECMQLRTTGEPEISRGLQTSPWHKGTFGLFLHITNLPHTPRGSNCTLKNSDHYAIIQG